MSYRVDKEGVYTVVRLSGEIDLSNSPEVREVVLDHLSRKDDVLIDLADVVYMDSSGVAALVEGYQTAKTGGLKFGLVNVSEVALNVLELARLDRVFPIRACVADYSD